MYRKLKTAARKVCGLDDGSRLTLDQGIARQECFDTALADAVRRINRPDADVGARRTARDLG